MAPYVRALCQEIGATGDKYPDHVVETVFLGGGTPSMLEPRSIEEILDQITRSFGIGDGAEISMEANPDTVDSAKLAGFRKAGINRISLGAQSLDPAELRSLGRGHGPADAARSVQDARAVGFDNLSLDLIYGTVGQTLESWGATLDGVLELEPDHISLYSLIIEPGTQYNRRRSQGKLPLPEDDLVADMYDLACRRLGEEGYGHYEVANWAKPGFQARHNLAYWRDEEFFAVGVGAYDYIRPYRSVRVRNTKRYIEAMEAGGDGIAKRDLVEGPDERFETAVLRLRLLQEGLSREVFVGRFGETLEQCYGPVLEELVEIGLIQDDGEVIRLVETKVPLANEAWERFLPPM